MVKKFFWKIWLRPNPLTKIVVNDYFAEVSTVNNTLRNKNIALTIVKEGRELHYETILSVLSKRDAIERRAILKGSSVQSGNIHIAPRVTGKWIGLGHVYELWKHNITVDATPTAEMRKALKEVSVEVLGKKTDGGAVTGLVTDVCTGKTDGTVSVGGSIIITGDKIKILPAGEKGPGVFFVDVNGTEIPLEPVVENNPKKIICILPAQLTGGT